MELEQPTQEQQEMSDQEAIMKIAAAMKDNAPSPEEKQSVHQFLFNVVTAQDSRKIGNLRDDKEMSELGMPIHNVRGSLEMARISSKIIDNEFYADFFKEEAEDTLATSLSREGFLVRQASTQVKKVEDITKRRRINKGWFSTKQEVSGGDNIVANQGGSG